MERSNFRAITNAVSPKCSQTWDSPRRWNRVGAKRHRKGRGNRSGDLPGREELLGRKVTVVRSTDPGLIGVTGEVLDETMKTLVLRSEDRRRLVLPKVAVTIRFELEGRSVDLDGSTILFRPEDRVKKVR